MDAIEEFALLEQDFQAAVLKAMTLRVERLEEVVKGADKRVEHRAEAGEKPTEKRFADSDRRAEERHEEVMSAVRQLIDLKALSRRVAVLEALKGA
jgi:hypothetical protein